jgi:hypothetical protein
MIRTTTVIFSVLLLAPAAASAQMTMRPADQPVVTAEQEHWYLDGEAIAYDGGLYYPAGPQVFFNPYEMVRSGIYRGIPLYARTTIEPYSVVFVPVARGLLQPYERRRRDQLAGTTGSAPSPTSFASRTCLQPGSAGSSMPRAILSAACRRYRTRTSHPQTFGPP